jgi:hypothetical protein
LAEAMQQSGTGPFSRPPTITMMQNGCAGGWRDVWEVRQRPRRSLGTVGPPTAERAPTAADSVARVQLNVEIPLRRSLNHATVLCCPRTTDALSNEVEAKRSSAVGLQLPRWPVMIGSGPTRPLRPCPSASPTDTRTARSSPVGGRPRTARASRRFCAIGCSVVHVQPNSFPTDLARSLHSPRCMRHPCLRA